MNGIGEGQILATVTSTNSKSAPIPVPPLLSSMCNSHGSSAISLLQQLSGGVSILAFPLMATYPPLTGVEERVDGAEDAFLLFFVNEEDLGRRWTSSGDLEGDRFGMGEEADSREEEGEDDDDERTMNEVCLISLL